MENAENTRIILNGIAISSKVNGGYVDEAIKTVALPALIAGKDELILQIPFGPKTNVEWCYLLGDFGVRVIGRCARPSRVIFCFLPGDYPRRNAGKKT